MVFATLTSITRSSENDLILGNDKFHYPAGRGGSEFSTPLTQTLLHRRCCCCCHRKWVETWGEEPPCLRSLKNVWGHEVAQMCVALLIRTDVAKTSSLLYPLAPVKNVFCPFCYSRFFPSSPVRHLHIFSFPFLNACETFPPPHSFLKVSLYLISHLKHWRAHVVSALWVTGREWWINKTNPTHLSFHQITVLKKLRQILTGAPQTAHYTPVDNLFYSNL